MSRNVAIVFLLVCLSLPAYSQQKATGTGDSMPHQGMGMMRMRGMASDQEIDRSVDTLQRTLDLSPSQATSVCQLAQARRDSVRSIREQARPKVEQLMTLLKQSNPDPAAVGKLVLDLKSTHEQVRAKQADFEKQFDSILNPTQRQTVNTLRSQAPTFMAMRRLGFLGVPEFTNGMFMSGFGRSDFGGSSDDKR